MSQLQAIILSFVALGAIVSLIGLSAGLYELVTGRLVPLLTKLRRRVPATDADLRQNAVAIVLNEVAALLMALLALGTLLLEQVRFNAILAGAYLTVSLAGFLAVGASGWASFLIKRKVHMVRRSALPQDPLTGVL
jgi:hypothetical protein